MFKFGLLTAILEEMNFEEVVSYASSLGLNCLEVACWPYAGTAARRYAGTCHINAESLTKKKAEEIKSNLESKSIAVTALGYYPNILESDAKKRETYVNHIYSLIDAAKLLDVNMISTFLGRKRGKTFSENLKAVKEIWMPILRYAEKKKVKIAIENCPMWFTDDEWPGGQNIMTSPENWKRIFDLLDSDCLGINFDPSHFVWQNMDYISPIYEFKEKIFHFHCKDIKVYPDKLKRVGVMANPLEYMTPKIPGLGDVNWSKFISAITDIGFKGGVVAEIEDKAFEADLTEKKHAIEQTVGYLRNYIG